MQTADRECGLKHDEQLSDCKNGFLLEDYVWVTHARRSYFNPEGARRNGMAINHTVSVGAGDAF